MNLGEARLLRVYGTLWSSLGLVSFPWVDRPLWTIERPWEGNAPFTSCIPPRIYRVEWTWSPKFGRFTWQVMDVPERTGIRWHRANFARDVEGCIGPGLRVGSQGGKLAVWNSGSALDLVDRPGREGAHFTLTVTNGPMWPGTRFAGHG